MQKPYLFLSALILTALLVRCAPKAAAQPEEVKVLEESTSTLTDLSARSVSNSTDTAQSEVVPHDPPAICPITVPQDPLFTPPAPYDSMGFEGEFWYGSNSLWTAVPQNGTWAGLPHNPEGYTQKVFWWRDGYVWNEEPQPDLTVTGERLDAPAPPLIVSKSANAYAADIGSAMLVGVDFPPAGCWKITGNYAATKLSFVVWVAP